MVVTPRDPIKLTLLQDFVLGSAYVSPASRSIRGPSGKAVVEPRMMQVLVALATMPGQLVTRLHLLERCWGGAPVGDDSINRAVAGLRRAFRTTACHGVHIETVPAAGYILAVDATDSTQTTLSERCADALLCGWQSWKLGLPRVDIEALDKLRQASKSAPDRSDVFGMLALNLRNAAEYAEPDLCPALVRECEAAAARAFVLEPGQIYARAAMIGLPPIFGDWLPRRRALLDALHENPDNFAVAHDLSMLEMATGRPSAALALNDQLIGREPLAATLHYKRIYLLWTADRLAEMDRVADRAMQLWPRHPAVWFARLWSLAFTGRVLQASQQLAEVSTRPALPAPAFETLGTTLQGLAQPAESNVPAAAVRNNVQSATRGPSQSIAAIMHLAGLGAVKEAFAVAEGYLLRRGPIAVGIHKTPHEPSITDQHRRVTQMLFIPVTAPLRADPRFLQLCEDMGMAAYWESAGITPDFLRAGSFAPRG